MTKTTSYTGSLANLSRRSAVGHSHIGVHRLDQVWVMLFLCEPILVLKFPSFSCPRAGSMLYDNTGIGVLMISSAK
jgi:hypothetical protein